MIKVFLNIMFLDYFSPAVGDVSSGSDSGTVSFFISFKSKPGHPTQSPIEIV